MTGQPQVTVGDAIEAINAHLAATRSDWTSVASTTRLDDLDLDSFEIANILLSLEETIGCRLSMDSIADAVRVEDLVTLGEPARDAELSPKNAQGGKGDE